MNLFMLQYTITLWINYLSDDRDRDRDRDRDQFLSSNNSLTIPFSEILRQSLASKGTL